MQIDRAGFMQQNMTPGVQIQQSNVNIPANLTPGQHKADMELKKQAQEFESVFLSQMFKQMRPKQEDQDLFGSTKDREMFNSMIDDERAKVWAQQGGIGLANIMFEQMKDTNRKSSL